MPQAVAAFVITFATQVITGATLAVAFKAALVVAALTHASSVLLAPDKPPPIQLADRKTNIRVPTPSRHIIYGEVIVGGSIVDLRVWQDDTDPGILPYEGRQLPEVHISPYRDRRHPVNGDTATQNALPVVRILGLGMGQWPISSRASLQASGNLVDEWTVYYVNRKGATVSGGAIRRGGLKQMEILYAIADNEITISHLFLANEQVDGEPSVDSNGLGTVRGDVYIRQRDHSGDTSTVIKRAQDEMRDLDHHPQNGLRSPGFAAAFLWDGTGNGEFQDIVAPNGRVGATSFDLDQPFMNPLPFRNYGNLGGYGAGYFVLRADQYNRGANDIMGSGVALLAASYFGYAKNTNIPWPTIPELTIQARGSVRDSTWTEVRRIVNDNAIFDALAYNNSAVCLYDYVLAHTEYGTDILGEKRINEASVRQAIIDCHDLGLTVRGRVNLDSRPDDVMGQLALAMRNGDVFDVGGTLHFIVGKPVAATHTITEDDVLEEWEFISGNPRDSRPDAINLEYVTLEGVGTDTVSLGNEFIRGGGSGVTEDLTLAFVGSRDQALDVGAIRLLQAQESQALRMRVQAKHTQILPHQTVMVDIPTLWGEGEPARKYRVLSVEPAGDLSLRLVMREERDAIWGGFDLIAGAGFLLLESSTEDAPMFLLQETGDKIIV